MCFERPNFDSSEHMSTTMCIIHFTHNAQTQRVLCTAAYGRSAGGKFFFFFHIIIIKSSFCFDVILKFISELRICWIENAGVSCLCDSSSSLGTACTRCRSANWAVLSFVLSENEILPYILRVLWKHGLLHFNNSFYTHTHAEQAQHQLSHEYSSIQMFKNDVMGAKQKQI